MSQRCQQQSSPCSTTSRACEPNGWRVRRKRDRRRPALGLFVAYPERVAAPMDVIAISDCRYACFNMKEATSPPGFGAYLPEADSFSDKDAAQPALSLFLGFSKIERRTWKLGQHSERSEKIFRPAFRFRAALGTAIDCLIQVPLIFPALQGNAEHLRRRGRRSRLRQNGIARSVGIA